MDKKRLIEIIQRILNTDADLSFLLQLEEHELEVLAASIRERIDRIAQ
jgi:hypothetical protein